MHVHVSAGLGCVNKWAAAWQQPGNTRMALQGRGSSCNWARVAIAVALHCQDSTQSAVQLFCRAWGPHGPGPGQRLLVCLRVLTTSSQRLVSLATCIMVLGHALLCSEAAGGGLLLGIPSGVAGRR
jgi:hypothetical protein